MLAFWDGSEKTALRIDLWTKDMMVDEMADFFYQTLMTMADTYGRATKYEDMTRDMKKFAKDFHEKFRKRQEGKTESIVSQYSLDSQLDTGARVRIEEVLVG